MVIQIDKHFKGSGSLIKGGLQSISYSNPLYQWLIRGKGKIDESMIPHDLWPGDAERGCEIINNQFMFTGHMIESSHTPWEPVGVSSEWVAELHSFSWLRDLRCVGGDIARRKTRIMMAEWIEQYNQWHPVLWRADVLGQRIAAWISLYQTFVASAEDEFRQNFVNSLIKQSKHLVRVFPGQLTGLKRLRALKGVLYGHICLTALSMSEHQLQTLLEKEMVLQVWQDGMHISRNPSSHLEALCHLIDIRNLLTNANITPPSLFLDILNRMAAALKFMRHGDGHLALFTGSTEEDRLLIDTTLSHSGYKGKAAKSLKQSGYVRLTMGRTTMIVDIGPEGVDIENWRSPAAFEISIGKKRLFVNCGTTAYPSRWRDMMTTTAAHNCLLIDDNEAAFQKYKDKNLEPRDFTFHDMDGSYLMELSHGGYWQKSRFRHQRRFHMSNHGNDIKGEDILMGPAGHSYTLRFHLHPQVKASLIQNNQEVLLQIPGHKGWRFSAGGHILSLEESLYWGDGYTMRKTEQIVIEGQTFPESTALQWTLLKEGETG